MGRNAGPDGTGNAVRFSGYEEWTLDEAGMIARALGHFDEAEYQRQLEVGRGMAEATAVDEVVPRNLEGFERDSERRERSPESVGVLMIPFEPDVEVARAPRSPIGPLGPS